MTRLRAKNTNTNLRTSPRIEAGNILAVMKPHTSLTGELYEGWYEVTVHVRADVVDVLPEPVPVPEGAIPYISQWADEANQRGSDCGQTCTAALARSRGVMVEVNDLPYQSDPKGLTTAFDLVKNFNHVGIAAEYRYMAHDEPPPIPSICLVKYSGFDRLSVQDKSYLGWHWLIILRLDTDTIECHDPDYWSPQSGAFKHYSRREWDKAFIPSGSAGRVVVVMT